MKRLLQPGSSYDDAMMATEGLDARPSFPDPVTFHTFWEGRLDQKHVHSLRSCAHHHRGDNYSIVLWLGEETVSDGLIKEEIHKLHPRIEIRTFDLVAEMGRFGLSSFLEVTPRHTFRHVSFYADLVRSVLLYNYGGCWFDLDFFFLRPFDPLFHTFGSEICVYEWEHEPYPNNAIYFCLTPRSARMAGNMRFIAERGRGWGFQEAELTYDLPLDLLVLPCAWFDPDWIPNPFSFGFDSFFKTHTGSLRFFEKCFGYHWHNRWHAPLEPDCILLRLCEEHLGVPGSFVDPGTIVARLGPDPVPDLVPDPVPDPVPDLVPDLVPAEPDST